MAKRPRNWNDPAGLNPETGEPIRVCDLVRIGEEILGVRHNPEKAKQWQEWWKRLNDEQRSQYRQARGQRPRRRA